MGANEPKWGFCFGVPFVRRNLMGSIAISTPLTVVYRFSAIGCTANQGEQQVPPRADDLLSSPWKSSALACVLPVPDIPTRSARAGFDLSGPSR
jgi:hypothetical protein